MATKENPLISIIIPVYNTEAYVEKCLDSIFSQTYTQIEVIIVNNGSSGNIEEIVLEYQRMYPDRLLKLVSHKVNQGTFHGRGSGMQIASGEYFTFMDADDHVGVDYFYQMIMAAEKSGAEIVMTDLVHEDENGKQFRYVEDPVRSMNFEIKGTQEVFDFYYRFQGLSYSMYGIWNKIYRRELWERCKPFIEAIEEHFALCEDAAYTTIFFSQANHVINIHNQYYYHYVRSDSASGSLIATVEKAKQNAVFQGTAFRNIKEHLKRAGLYDNYKECFEEFRNFHLRVMLFQIENSKFRWDQIRFLKKFCCEQFEEEHPGKLSQDEMFFTTHFVEQTATLEKLREKIVSGKYKVLAINIFDTALVSTMWSQEDVFRLMQTEFERITGIRKPFVNMRVEAEQLARAELNQKNSFYSEITLEDIYAKMSQRYKLKQENCNDLLEKELEMREKTLAPRKIILELWDLAKRMGLKLYLIGDSVLPLDWVSGLINKLGYSGCEEVILSSELKKGAVTIKTFRKMALKADGNILYFSSTSEKRDIENYAKDVDLVYVPKTLDMLVGENNGEFYGGKVVHGAYNSAELDTHIGIRTLLTQVANVFFDNPFEKYDKNSDYNGEPYNMGYLAGGSYVLSTMQWLLEKLRYKKSHKITFIDQKRNVFSDVLKELAQAENYELEIQEIIVDNNEISALPFISSIEELYQLSIIKNLENYSPRKFLQYYKYFCNSEILEKSDEILKENNILPDEMFSSSEQYYEFVKVIEPYTDFSKVRENEIGIEIETTDIFLTGMNMNAIWKVYGYKDKHIFSILDIPQIETESYVIGTKKEEERIIMNTFFRVEQKDDFIGCKVVLRLFQQGVRDFVKDYLKEYGNYQKILCSSCELNDRFMDNLINEGKKVDRFVLLPFKVGDEDIKIRVMDLWNQNVRNHCRRGYDSISSDEWIFSYSHLQSRWQKLIFIIFFDRRILKAKISDRLKNHPALLRMIRNIYNVLRNFKHKCHNKK